MTTPEAGQRIAYHNGHFVSEREVKVPFRDRGFTRGDAVFDTSRTFNGQPFRLQEHIDRLFRSLSYVQIEPPLNAEELLDISNEVLARNRPLLGKNEDYWLFQRVTRGLDAVGDEGWATDGPTVIVDCFPLMLKERAHLFRDGIELLVSSLRRVPPMCISPNAKSHNYLNLVLAHLEAQAQNPNAWALLLDIDDHLAESDGSNIFVVKKGTLYTPREEFVLAGVSRQTVIELAAELGIPCSEADLTVDDAVEADEIFLTSTSLCLCPVQRFNGHSVGSGEIQGAITEQLTAAYSRLVGCDIRAQYLAHLP